MYDDAVVYFDFWDFLCAELDLYFWDEVVFGDYDQVVVGGPFCLRF